MSELVWKGLSGNVTAHGARGMYTIQSLSGGTYVLQGADGEARQSLGFLGQVFGSLGAAKVRAAAIEDAS